MRNLHDAVRASIDRFKDAHETFEDQINEFGGAIRDTKSSLIASLKPQMPPDDEDEMQEGGAVASSDLMLSTEAASPLPSLFQNLEEHATQCASLLQSLVRHYDLCVTALKHTEGGGAAIEQATGSLPNAQDLPTGLGLDLESIDQDAPPQPMFEEERADMLAVLSKDAAEVDDVVGEIRERLADMEEQYAHIDNYVSSLRISAQKLHATLKRLTTIVTSIESYIAASTTFLTFWEQEKDVMESKQEELESLREFYEEFCAAYDGLVLEVSRRRSVQVAMDKVVKEAQKKLEDLYQDDMEDRETWRAEIGEFLPSDIWPGLNDPPSRYEVQKVDGPSSVPRVRKEMLEEAKMRLAGGRRSTGK